MADVVVPVDVLWTGSYMADAARNAKTEERVSTGRRGWVNALASMLAEDQQLPEFVSGPRVDREQVVDDVDDHVLLTGATGFVGSHIAVALLAATQSSRLRICCVVRAESDAEARTRLVSTLVKICSDASVIAQDPRLVAIALPSSCDDPGRAVAILLDIRRRCDVTHVARPLITCSLTVSYVRRM